MLVDLQRPPLYDESSTRLRATENSQRALSKRGAAIFTAYLEAFNDCQPLQQRVRKVLHALPEVVQRDFLDDPCFRVTLCNFVPGKGWTLLMDAPGSSDSTSRCVVLRPRLADASEAFACYVIAHEFAHAYLRNGPWGEILDVEQAADALAASWGFSRPGERV